jgi:hypothetical protein
VPAYRSRGWLLWDFNGGLLDGFVFDLDGRKALLRDAQRAGTFVIAPPHRQRAARWDLLDEALRQELGDDLTGRAAGQIGRPFEETVVAPRCRRRLPPSPPKPRSGREAGGVEFRRAWQALETLTVPLHSAGKASHFWILFRQAPQLTNGQ